MRDWVDLTWHLDSLKQLSRYFPVMDDYGKLLITQRAEQIEIQIAQLKAEAIEGELVSEENLAKDDKAV